MDEKIIPPQADLGTLTIGEIAKELSNPREGWTFFDVIPEDQPKFDEFLTSLSRQAPLDPAST